MVIDTEESVFFCSNFVKFFFIYLITGESLMI